jgi:hypothetical protein
MAGFVPGNGYDAKIVGCSSKVVGVQEAFAPEKHAILLALACCQTNTDNEFPYTLHSNQANTYNHFPRNELLLVREGFPPAFSTRR